MRSLQEGTLLLDVKGTSPHRREIGLAHANLPLDSCDTGLGAFYEHSRGGHTYNKGFFRVIRFKWERSDKLLQPTPMTQSASGVQPHPLMSVLVLIFVVKLEK